MSANPNLPASYREQKACANCRHVFERREYDQGPDYFCTLRAPPRPKAMTDDMGDGEEFIGPIGSDAYHVGRDVWRAWSMGRRVWPERVCDEHEARE